MNKPPRFSRSPLNYETWSNRISKAKGNVSPASMADCIWAARYLQRGNPPPFPNLIGNTGSNRPGSDFLGISSHSRLPHVIEAKLVRFLQVHPDVTCTDHVMRAYMLTKPYPNEVSHVIEWTSACIAAQIRTGYYDGQKAVELVFLTLRRLLALKDYHNAFKLVDCTLALELVLRANRSRSTAKWLRQIGGIVVSGGIAAFLNVNLGVIWVICGVFWGAMWSRVSQVHRLNRVAWRPHSRFAYRMGREAELYAVNMIVAHYEEHLEVNVRNFHHSEVRTVGDANMVTGKGYVLEIPAAEKEIENEIESEFRRQLLKRRMVMREMQEEIMFLDFWLSQGERYEWVEPDQDPAEIIELKTQKYMDN